MQWHIRAAAGLRNAVCVWPPIYHVSDDPRQKKGCHVDWDQLPVHVCDTAHAFDGRGADRRALVLEQLFHDVELLLEQLFVFGT